MRKQQKINKKDCEEELGKKKIIKECNEELRKRAFISYKLGYHRTKIKFYPFLILRHFQN